MIIEVPSVSGKRIERIEIVADIAPWSSAVYAVDFEMAKGLCY